MKAKKKKLLNCEKWIAFKFYGCAVVVYRVFNIIIWIAHAALTHVLCVDEIDILLSGRKFIKKIERWTMRKKYFYNSQWYCLSVVMHKERKSIRWWSFSRFACGRLKIIWFASSSSSQNATDPIVETYLVRDRL